MGWEVAARELILYRGECAEIGSPANWRRAAWGVAPEAACGWIGSPKMTLGAAEADAAQHRKEHEDAYAAYQAMLEGARAAAALTEAEWRLVDEALRFAEDDPESIFADPECWDEGPSGFGDGRTPRERLAGLRAKVAEHLR